MTAARSQPTLSHLNPPISIIPPLPPPIVIPNLALLQHHRRNAAKSATAAVAAGLSTAVNAAGARPANVYARQQGYSAMLSPLERDAARAHAAAGAGSARKSALFKEVSPSPTPAASASFLQQNHLEPITPCSPSSASSGANPPSSRQHAGAVAHRIHNPRMMSSGRLTIVPGAETSRAIPDGAVVARSTGNERVPSEASVQRYRSALDTVMGCSARRRASLPDLSPLVGLASSPPPSSMSHPTSPLHAVSPDGAIPTSTALDLALQAARMSLNLRVGEPAEPRGPMSPITPPMSATQTLTQPPPAHAVDMTGCPDHQQQHPQQQPLLVPAGDFFTLSSLSSQFMDPFSQPTPMSTPQQQQQQQRQQPAVPVTMDDPMCMDHSPDPLSAELEALAAASCAAVDQAEDERMRGALMDFTHLVDLDAASAAVSADPWRAGAFGAVDGGMVGFANYGATEGLEDAIMGEGAENPVFGVAGDGKGAGAYPTPPRARLAKEGESALAGSSSKAGPLNLQSPPPSPGQKDGLFDSADLMNPSLLLSANNQTQFFW